MASRRDGRNDIHPSYSATAPRVPPRAVVQTQQIPESVLRAGPGRTVPLAGLHLLQPRAELLAGIVGVGTRREDHVVERKARGVESARIVVR